MHKSETSVDRQHRTRAELDAELDRVRQSPAAIGRLEIIVCRPDVGARTLPETATLDPVRGLDGDNWSARSSPDVRRQITLMNARAADLVSGGRQHAPLAGDQLFVDFDLSVANVPAGTRLAIGDAILEITPPPHRGCHTFTARFGADATAWVNSPAGVELNLRGVNARVVRAGTVRVGDTVTKHPI